MRGVFLVPLLLACGGMSAEERQLADLREDINRIQSDRDKLDQRLASIEVKEADQKDAKPGAVPPQRIIRMNPDGTEQAQTDPGETAGADPDDGSPRPVIHVQGAGGRMGGKAGPDIVQETLPDEDSRIGAAGPPITQGGPRPAALDPDAKRSYDAALGLVNSKQYQAALEAFAAFLVRWPDHPYADNATYWRGECYFAQGEYARAAEQFEGVIARFPLGNKVPDSWLKLGIAQQKLGNQTRARAAFDKLAHDYPKSDAARRIPRTETP
jgi:tol-pal system protein YbgF